MTENQSPTFRNAVVGALEAIGEFGFTDGRKVEEDLVGPKYPPEDCFMCAYLIDIRQESPGDPLSVRLHPSREIYNSKLKGKEDEIEEAIRRESGVSEVNLWIDRDFD